MPHRNVPKNMYVLALLSPCCCQTADLLPVIDTLHFLCCHLWLHSHFHLELLFICICLRLPETNSEFALLCTRNYLWVGTFRVVKIHIVDFCGMMLQSLVGCNYLPVCRLQHHKQDCNIQVIITSPSHGLGFSLILILFLFLHVI